MRNKKLIYLALMLTLIIYIFMSDYIFQGLLVAKGQSIEVREGIPDCSQDILYYFNIEKEIYKWKECINIQGWSFVKKYPNDVDKEFIVFNSNDSIHKYTAVVLNGLQNDVREMYNLESMDNLRFDSHIPLYNIPDGTYNIGIEIQNKYGSFYSASDKYIIIKNRKIWQPTPQAYSVPPVKSENNKLRYRLSEVNDLNDPNTLQLHGIEYSEKKPVDGYVIYLGNDKIDYAFKTEKRVIDDYAWLLENEGVESPENYMFFGSLPIKDIEPGKYAIGVLAEYDNVFEYNVSLQNIFISGEETYMYKPVREAPVYRYKVDESVISYIDIFDESNGRISVNGWAYVININETLNEFTIVLKSNAHCYIIPADKALSPDVAAAFKDSGANNLDSTRFEAIFLSDMIAPGEYSVGINVENEFGEFYTTFSGITYYKN